MRASGVGLAGKGVVVGGGAIVGGGGNVGLTAGETAVVGIALPAAPASVNNVGAGGIGVGADASPHPVRASKADKIIRMMNGCFIRKFPFCDMSGIVWGNGRLSNQKSAFHVLQLKYLQRTPIKIITAVRVHTEFSTVSMKYSKNLT